MKKLLRFALAVAFLLTVTALPMQSAEALYQLKYWHVTIRDQQGDLITSGLTVTVRTVDTTTAATIYSDASASSMSNAFDPGTDGVADWWSATSTLDILVDDGVSRYTLQDATVNNHEIVLVQTDCTEKTVQLPIGAFKIIGEQGTVGTLDYVQNITGEYPVGATSATAMTSAPNYDIQNGIMCIVWADNEESEIEQSFRVPADYSSGGAFRAWAATSSAGGAATDPSVGLDYAVFTNTDSAAADTASDSETVIDVNSDWGGDTGSENEYAMSSTATFAAGTLVSLRLWRDEETYYTGTGNLELFHVTFYYSAKH